VLRNADLAMYTAKMRGRGRVEVYEPVMHQRAIDRFDIETSLRRAIEAGQLVLAYQPIADLTTGEVVALEALIRWNHPVRGLLLPDAFIPVAEETGLIPLVGAFVLREACRQVRIWQGAYAAAARLSVGVNVSALEITRPDFAVEAGKAIASSGLRSSSLVIEITENALASDTAAAARNLDELKQLGCQIAVDDFGTGYASLAYLQQYPVDILKLDRCFVEGIDGLPKQAALPEAIIRLAQHLGLGLIAEGVERQTQRDRLVEAGCGLAQGYLLGRPMDAAAFGALLAAGGRVATLPASAAIG
jgi:EAL domain-containing protein (putative c-di-GMP-specific phosphodiesterase class I)